MYSSQKFKITKDSYKNIRLKGKPINCGLVKNSHLDEHAKKAVLPLKNNSLRNTFVTLARS